MQAQVMLYLYTSVIVFVIFASNELKKALVRCDGKHTEYSLPAFGYPI